MERLYTPWRREYIEDGSMESRECIFCFEVMEQAIQEKLVLFSTSRTMVMCNRYPYTTGHLLIAPREHNGDLCELAGDVSGEMFRLLQESIRIIKNVYRPEGMNVGMNLGKVAGAGFAHHLHIHVLPRWGGDTNFMTPLCEVRVLPETVSQTYDRLIPHFNELKI